MSSKTLLILIVDVDVEIYLVHRIYRNFALHTAAGCVAGPGGPGHRHTPPHEPSQDCTSGDGYIPGRILTLGSLVETHAAILPYITDGACIIDYVVFTILFITYGL